MSIKIKRVEILDAWTSSRGWAEKLNGISGKIKKIDEHKKYINK